MSQPSSRITWQQVYIITMQFINIYYLKRISLVTNKEVCTDCYYEEDPRNRFPSSVFHTSLSQYHGSPKSVAAQNPVSAHPDTPIGMQKLK